MRLYERIIRFGPLGLGVSYLVVGLVWIYASDQILEAIAPNDEVLHDWQTLKGFGFVIVCSMGLYTLSRQMLGSVQSGYELYRELFENNPHPMWVYDVATLKFLAVNQAAIIRYGYSEEEFLQRSILDIRPDEDREAVSVAARRKRNQGYHTGIWRHRYKSGEIIFAEITSQHLVYQGREACLVSAINVTARLNAEQENRKLLYETQQLNEKLTHSEEELRQNLENTLDLATELERSQLKLTQIIDNVEAAIYTIDPHDERITLLNKGITKLSGGYTPQDFYRETDLWSTLVFPEDYDRYFNWVDGIKMQKPDREKIYRIRGKDGKIRWVMDRSSLIHHPETGRLEEIHGAAWDITEAYEARQELEEKQILLSAALDASISTILLVNAEGQVLTFNQRAAQVIARSIGRAPQPGDLAASYVPEYEKPQWFQRLQRVLSGATEEYEIAYPDASGMVIYLKVVISPIVRPDGSIYGALVNTWDQTALRSTQESLEQSNKALRITNENLRQFAYIASHNLRAPVANILGIVHLLESHPIDDPVLLNLKGFLQQSTTRLDQTIRDLNDILAMSRDRSNLTHWLRLEDLLKEVSTELATQIEESQAQIEADFVQAPQVHCIPAFAHSIFFNLVQNAIKYRREGVRPVVSVRSWIDSQGHLVVSVRDNGRGIDLKKYGDVVFSLYHRFHPDVEGRGLGLYMIQQQAEAMGGHLSLESEPGQGSVFYWHTRQAPQAQG